ncbi:hypothetical protein GDO81_019733 [Engystomops pustulosus]|uniref:G-protein coupled receptors family 1 profile domain-containing protein n=1 Tax=Engystomops pustulosus TaxID=76066 RepID=A0AAV6YWG6_ENGPU|nr:hypothetical protein GDO81_019733 [Engystomops pustulosus]
MQEIWAKNLSAPEDFVLLGLVDIPSLQIPLFVVFFVIYIMTIFGNLTIITMIQLETQLHKPMYFFLANLSLIEVFYTTTIMPNSLRNFLHEDMTISYIGCFTQIYFFVAFGGSECILLLSHFFCDIPPILRLSCEHNTYVEHFVNLIGGCLVISGFSIILGSYIVIIKTVLQTSGRNRKYKIFSTAGSHLIVVTLFFTLLIPFLHPHSSSSSDEEKVVSMIYAVVTPLLNPFIYSIRNKDFQKAVKKKIRRIV